MLSGNAVAVASDHVPPEAELLANGATLQHDGPFSYCWTSPSGDGFVTACADGILQFPAAATVRSGTVVTIRILKPKKPTELHIAAWSRLNRHGMPAGDPTELRYKRKRAHQDRVAGWDFSFVAANTARHYYLIVFGTWPDEDGAGLQDASWAFHVRTAA